jgi:DNA polymerase III sliding clamp (beta) subunit (PCNA family)
MKIKTLKQIRTIICPRKATLPILESFYIDKDFLTLSNLEIVIKVRHQFPIKEALNPLVAQSDHFISILENIKAPYLINCDENQHIEFTMPESKRVMKGTNYIDFPETLPVNSKPKMLFNISAYDVKTLIAAAGFVADDELRPVMEAVCISRDLVCGSDAHKLFYGKITERSDTEVMILPKVIRLMKLFPEYWYKISECGKMLIFENDDITIYQRKVDQNYPNFRSVITEKPLKFILPVKETIDAIKSIEFAANQVVYLVNFNMKGSKLTLTCKDLDYSLEASETINIINPENHKIEWGFKLQFINQILKTLSDKGYAQVTVAFEDSTKSFTFEDQLLLMPMMLNA